MKPYRRGVPDRTVHMIDHLPERRRFIRSRADLEFQLARITLALSRAPIARQPELREWFDEAATGLLTRTAAEHCDYVEERVASIRETFFGTPSTSTRLLRPLRPIGHDAIDRPGRGPASMH